MLERQIIDTKTGEVKSRGTLGENTDFIMLFRTGMDAVTELAKCDGKAFALLSLIMRHMDRENALVASRDVLAELLEFSVPTVDRKIKVLKDKQFLDVVKSGTSNIYLVNSSIAWTTYGNKKQYSKFSATVLVGKSEQQYRSKSSNKRQLEIFG